MFLNRQSPTERAIADQAPPTLVLLRIAMAFVFVTEGIQKFLYPELLGVGRFTKIGIPYPEFSAPLVGGVEVVGGALVLLGLYTRLAAFPLVIDMIVAITATKVPILLGYGFWGFASPSGKTGFWAAAHEARLDIMMLLSCATLLVIGPGKLSFDQRR
ncbi:MAG TPA: DoxX family protein [Kofleriaceae bacterium]